MIALSIDGIIGRDLERLLAGWSFATINFSIVLAYLVALRFKRVC